MVCLFLGADGLLVALFPTTDDRVGHVEGGQLDAGDVGGVETVLLPDVQCGVEGRLGVDLGVVLLDDRPGHRLQVLGRPVEGVVTGQGLEALVAFDDLLGAGDSAGGQQCRPGSLLGHVRVGEPLPVVMSPLSAPVSDAVARAAPGEPAMYLASAVMAPSSASVAMELVMQVLLSVAETTVMFGRLWCDRPFRLASPSIAPLMCEESRAV